MSKDLNKLVRNSLIIFHSLKWNFPLRIMGPNVRVNCQSQPFSLIPSWLILLHLIAYSSFRNIVHVSLILNVIKGWLSALTTHTLHIFHGFFFFLIFLLVGSSHFSWHIQLTSVVSHLLCSRCGAWESHSGGETRHNWESKACPCPARALTALMDINMTPHLSLSTWWPSELSIRPSSQPPGLLPEKSFYF